MKDAQVDWFAGTVRAQAGAAADMRMPSADQARPGAERRARAAAGRKLREALAVLPLGGGRFLDSKAIDAALEHATTAEVEYQSNGGVVLTLGVSFSDLVPAAGAANDAIVLSTDSAVLEVAPALLLGNAEARVGFAVSRQGQPPAKSNATDVRTQKDGRLAVGKNAGLDKSKVAGAQAVIYVQKIFDR